MKSFFMLDGDSISVSVMPIHSSQWWNGILHTSYGWSVKWSMHVCFLDEGVSKGWVVLFRSYLSSSYSQSPVWTAY